MTGQTKIQKLRDEQIKIDKRGWSSSHTESDLVRLYEIAEEIRQLELPEIPKLEPITRRCRLPGEFDVWPSDEQMEHFKRGGR
jgi:hypothetical protein